MIIYQTTVKIPSESSHAVIYNSALQNDRAYALIDPTLDGECGKAGTFEFDIPYGHPYWNKLTKLTTEVVFLQDDEELFRGRVYEIKTDIETERHVTCEGNLSYLVDSLQPPDRIKGKNTHTVEYDSEDGETTYSKEYSMDKEEGTKETLEAHFRRLISKHNEQVEAWKQFTVGDITIDEKATEIVFDDSSYRDTLKAIESDLINLYGGWLRTRRVGDTTYIDWLKDYGSTSTQTFNYGHNIIEFDYTSNAEDIFTIFVPVGDDGLTIASVNNGNIGIENAAGIATYGRIYKTESFSGVADAAKLKSLGESYMQKNYKDPRRSISVNAVDMRLIDPSVRAFHLGDKIRLVAPVQGIDETIECLSYSITPNNPENNTYELGDRDESLSQKWTKDSDKNASDAANAARSARTAGGGAGQLFKYMWEQEHDLFANYDKITITANKLDATIQDLQIVAGDVASQYTRIIQNAHNIELYATKSGINSLGQNETLYSKINLNADSINQVVSKTGITGLQEGETLMSRILQNGNKIEMVVSDVGGEATIKAAAIVAEINKQTGQSKVTLSADQIDMDGLINLLATRNLNTISLTATGYVDANRVEASNYILAPTVYLGSSVSEAKSLASGIWDVTLTGPVGNVYTLKKTLFNGSELDIGSFSRATTLNGAWSGGVYTVNASPQGNTISTQVSMGPGSWNGNAFSGQIIHSEDGGDTFDFTGAAYSVDASSRYNAGYSDGQSDGGLAIDYDNNNISAANSQTKVAYIQATAGISYNSQSHRYTATGKAQVAPSGSGYSDMDTATAVSGTEAYDSGVSAGYGSARLSLNTASHTVNIGNTGNVVSGTVSVDGIIGEFDGESMAFPVTVQAKINDTVMASKLVWVEAFIPEEGGDYETGYSNGYQAGLAAARLQLRTDRGTISIGTSGSRTEVGVTVHLTQGSWDPIQQWRPITITAKVDGVTMASYSTHILGPYG